MLFNDANNAIDIYVLRNGGSGAQRVEVLL